MNIYPTSDEVQELIRTHLTSYYQIIKHQHTEFFSFLQESVPGRTLAEKLYRYCFPEPPSCLHCGSSNVGFKEFTTGYRPYCSHRCQCLSDNNRTGFLKYKNDPIRVQQMTQKCKHTSIQRYGAAHHMLTDEGKLKNSVANKETYRRKFPREVNGRTRKQYTNACRHLTNSIYEEFKHLIDPSDLRGQGAVVDHVYSINDGFVNGVPIDVVCHWTNLQMISKSENSRKGPRSGKTLAQLYEGANSQRCSS